jgi:hypothetical protein
MDIQEVKWEGTDLTELALNRDKWQACECNNKPSGSKNCKELLH